jgi:hypothetical protein
VGKTFWASHEGSGPRNDVQSRSSAGPKRDGMLRSQRDPPGHAQADFGEAPVIISGVEQKAHFFVLDLPHSDACFVRAYPAATAEAWVDGRVHAFAFW